MRLLGEFFHPGKIKAKGRPRFGAGGRAFTDKATAQAEEGLGYSALLARPEKVAEGPLFVAIVFTHAVPKSWPKWKRARAEAGGIHRVGAGDLDNHVKLVLDAINHAGWWVDDRQVAWLQAWATYGLVAGTTVKVCELDALEDLR